MLTLDQDPTKEHVLVVMQRGFSWSQPDLTIHFRVPFKEKCTVILCQEQVNFSLKS